MVISSKQANIKIDKEEVFRDIGYDYGHQPPSRVLSLVDEYIDNAYDMIEPSYSYVIKDVMAVQDSRVLLDDRIAFQGDVIARLLKRCKKVAVSVVTIGGYLEGTARRLAREGNLLQSSVLDAIGSQAVHKVADFVHCAIETRARYEGFIVSRRFSPGYCDWNIDQQLMVFHAVGRDTTSVHLTDHCLMIPSKSISGIVGIGAADSGVSDYNPCGICDRADCAGRR